MFGNDSKDSNNQLDNYITAISKVLPCFDNKTLKSSKELTDTRILFAICNELDSSFFALNMHLLFDNDYGVKFSELKEVTTKLYEYVKNSGTNFKLKFTEFESFNISNLIKSEENEMKKLGELIIVSLFNCSKKDNLIERFDSNLDEYLQSDLLKVVEKYMRLEESRRNTMNSQRDSFGKSSEVNNRYHQYIESLEKEKEAIEKEYKTMVNIIEEKTKEIEKLSKENRMWKENFTNLDELNKSLICENEELKENINILEISLKESKNLSDIKSQLENKNNEIKYIKQDKQIAEETYLNEIISLKETIETLKDNIGNLLEYKNNYEKLKDSIRDYELLKDKIKEFDNTVKEYNRLETIYKKELENSKEKSLLINNLEIEIQQFKKQIENTDKVSKVSLKNSINNLSDKTSDKEYLMKIEDLENQVKESDKNAQNLYKLNEVLEEKIRFYEEGKTNNNSEIVKNFSSKVDTNIEDEFYFDNKIAMIESERDNLKDNIKIKEDTIKIQEETINSLSEQVKEIELENEKLRKLETAEISRKNEEIEKTMKLIQETKEKYEREFELVSSALYTLGLSYWTMKVEANQKVSDNPTWLMKERQKYYNGDN